MGRRQSPKEEPIAVPGWVLTFGDMVTNLMACFVMLQALATTQDRTLFNAGLGSFKRAVAQFGLPDWMFGKEDRPDYGHRQQRYPTEEARRKDPDHVRRIIDAEDEHIRQTFKELQEELETRGDDLPRRALLEVAAPLTFAPGSHELTAADRDWVQGMGRQLKQDVRLDDVSIYVVGLTSGADADLRPAALAARRAAGVEQALRDQLAGEIANRRWRVDSWSAPGPADQGRSGPGIVIVVRHAGDSHDR